MPQRLQAVLSFPPLVIAEIASALVVIANANPETVNDQIWANPTARMWCIIGAAAGTAAKATIVPIDMHNADGWTLFRLSWGKNLLSLLSGLVVSPFIIARMGLTTSHIDSILLVSAVTAFFIDYGVIEAWKREFATRSATAFGAMIDKMLGGGK